MLVVICTTKNVKGLNGLQKTLNKIFQLYFIFF